MSLSRKEGVSTTDIKEDIRKNFEMEYFKVLHLLEILLKDWFTVYLTITKSNLKFKQHPSSIKSGWVPIGTAV